MTREIRYTGKGGGNLRTPKYIDHGHWGRKTVWLTVFILLIPVALLSLTLMVITNGLNWVGGNVNDLRVWAHPCLYGKGPGRDRETER